MNPSFQELIKHKYPDLSRGQKKSSGVSRQFYGKRLAVHGWANWQRSRCQ